MTPEEIQAAFRHFAAPLAFYRELGAGDAAIGELARNLWAVFLGGDAVEREYWSAMTAENKLDAGLLSSLRACYEGEMKPGVPPAALQALRDHYGIQPREGSSPG